MKNVSTCLRRIILINDRLQTNERATDSLIKKIIKRRFLSIKTDNKETLEDFVSYDPKEFLLMRNFGKKSFNDLREFVESPGLKFGMNLTGIQRPDYSG